MAIFSTFKILAGDYPKGEAQICLNSIVLPWQSGDRWSTGRRINTSEIELIDIASEESVKKIGGTVGWGG